MKTTIALAATLLAVSPFATAEDITLAWGDDFNGYTNATYAIGDDKVGKDGQSWKVYGNRSTPAMSQHDISKMGVSTSAGFTLAINFKAVRNVSNSLCYIAIQDPTAGDSTTLYNYDIKDTVTKNSGVYTHKLSLEANGTSTAGGEEFGAVAETASAELQVEKDVWYSIFLTVKGSDYTLTAMSLDGEVIGTDNGTLSYTGSIWGVGLGAGSGQNTSFFYADNFGVYNGVLTTEQMKEVTLYEVENENGEMLASVKSAAPTPEPTTATLSLLALAGLAARRRRK